MPVVKEVEITTVKERGCCGMCGNIIWLIFGGLELALVRLSFEGRARSSFLRSCSLQRVKGHVQSIGGAFPLRNVDLCP